MSGQPVRDDEVLLRRIPSGESWLEPPDRVTTLNFKLRRGEQGLSVFRESVVNQDGLLSRPDTIPGSFVLRAVAGDIRRLCNANGRPLELDVLAVDDADNPGHAEIRGPLPGRLSSSASKALRTLFARSFPRPSPA